MYIREARGVHETCFACPKRRAYGDAAEDPRSQNSEEGDQGQDDEEDGQPHVEEVD